VNADAGRELERRCECFGSTAGVLIGVPRAPGARDPQLQALAIEASLGAAHRELTRFEPESELSRLNRDPETTVAVTGLLASFAAAAAWAARRSKGLVDATVIDAVEAAGYRESRRDRAPADLTEALTMAPERRPARPRDPSPWAGIDVDPASGRVTRPPGLRLDSGGIAKGLLADRCAEALAGYSSFAIDCAGDLRIGGADRLERRLEVSDPFSGESVLTFGLTEGAVATSGLRRRIWRQGDVFSHHLIDPGRGTPAWTGLVQATAVAPTALEAETLAKAALLSGPTGAGAWLGRWGGVVFDDHGAATAYGPLRARLEPVAEAAYA
jgi:thiamine biosynthesis lipoprotein